MIKHTQTIRRQQSRNCLSVFDHFWGLAFKGLNVDFGKFVKDWNIAYSEAHSKLSEKCRDFTLFPGAEVFVERHSFRIVSGDLVKSRYFLRRNPVKHLIFDNFL